MPCPTVIFLKAQIRGGAAADLFATPVTVAPHVRDGKVVPGYTAIRHKAPWASAPEPMPPASNGAPKSDTLSGEATQDDKARFAAVDAAYVARRTAREAAKAAYVVNPYDSRHDADPIALALRAAEDLVAREEIAAQVPRPSTPESMRALLGIPADWHIEPTFTAGKARPRVVTIPKLRERLLLRFDGQQTHGQWQAWNFGQSSGGGYWEKWGGQKPLAEAIAWREAKLAEWAAKAEEQRQRQAEMDRQAAETEAANKRALAAPVELDEGAIAPGTYGPFALDQGRFGKDADQGYFLRFKFNATDVDRVKELPGRRWDAENRAWFIPAASQAQLRALLDLDKPTAPPAAPERPAYTAYVLPPQARDALLAMFPPRYPNLVGHHITVEYGVADDAPLPFAPFMPKIVGIADDGAGVEALVVEIDGSTNRPAGGTWHITWSLADGREARESNDAIAAGWRTLPET